ncbi:MAG: HAMP domain-containing sensor histidine kinase [Synechococcaceae cyanobacterium]|nr:HAMP domain-containing sensor histidine kinase [Synechococcaceae cyanobacterium]
MPVSERFLALLRHQLGQFADCRAVRSLVVYVTHQAEEGQPSLLPVGQWPSEGRSLPAAGDLRRLRVPAEERRWLPLRDGPILLGALQVETEGPAWPDPLARRLQAVALCLTEALRLDLDRRRLERRLEEREEQLRLLVHQLRNPLAALRTFGQLLLRRLEHDGDNRSLVEGLLAEERQLQRYVDAIDDLARPEALPEGAPQPQPLLLPPLLGGPDGQPLAEPLEPLVQRASATAALQGRPWRGPDALPVWRGDSGSVAEILANLLENAFRYSPPGSAVGLHCAGLPPAAEGETGGLGLTVWDAGPPIAADERERIFARGERGARGGLRPGTGLGLALARDLAQGLGGRLELVIPPRSVDPSLPAQGNAFRLTLPGPAPTPPR